MWGSAKTRARRGKPTSHGGIEFNGVGYVGVEWGMEFLEEGPAEAEQAQHF